MMDGKHTHKPSTSALAKALGIASPLLFTTLKDYGWIQKVEEGWALTSKGEFEGGEYIHSKKFGRYIVWPQELVDHPLLQALEDNRHVSATALGKAYGLNARQVNRLLAELAWIKQSFQGWELTTLGERCGGVQLENESSGTFYIVWPETVQQDITLIRQLQLGSEISGDAAALVQAGSDERAHYLSVDGHQHKRRVQLQVCHWLYMAGIAHSCQRQLPVDEILLADFYLPAYQLYIECWSDEQDSGELASKMSRKDCYKKLGLIVIDIGQDDLATLDEVMTRKLRQYGIRIY